MNALQQFIHSNPSTQELKRALAVEMTQQGYTYRQIQSVLQVSLGFITYCNERYSAVGVEGLKLLYWGTQGYLSVQQKQELFDWLRGRDYWTIEEVMEHLEQQYDVVYQSRQSYYALLKLAGLSWKSSQPTHPHLVPIANHWHKTLGREMTFPLTLSDFLLHCHKIGQSRSTPLLLKYESGDYNCLHQDLYGELVFPLQLTVLLSDPTQDFLGGEFVLTEQRPRMQSRAEVVSLGSDTEVVVMLKSSLAEHCSHE